MATRPPSAKVIRSAETIGDQLGAWRRLQGLTAQQVAERAGIGRVTVAKIEAGDLGVRVGSRSRIGRTRSPGRLD